MSRKLRIAQIACIRDHNPWFVEISRKLVERGYEVIAIIDEGGGDLAERLTQAGIRHSRVRMTFAAGLDRARLPIYMARLPNAVLRIARILRAERIEIAHSHVFVANVLSRVATRLAGVAHVAGIAGARQLEVPLTRSVERWMTRMDVVVQAGCEYVAGFYRPLHSNPADVRCVYYGTNAERFDPGRVDRTAVRRELAIPPGAPVVGLVAQFYPPTYGPQTPASTRGVGLKGHEVLLDAVPRILERVPEARFVLVGAGSNPKGERYRQSLIERCRAAAWGERVLFPGYRHDLPEVLASFDIALQCSLTEGLGGTIDALMMERPMVVTRVGGMPESVRHEETGLLVPPADAGALADAVLRLLLHPGEAARYARQARALAVERFTLDRTSADLDVLYRDLVARRA